MRLLFLVIISVIFSFNAALAQKSEESKSEKSDPSIEEELNNAVNKGVEALEGLFNKKPKKNREKPSDETRTSTTSKPSSKNKSTGRTNSETTGTPFQNTFVGSFNAEMKFYKNEKLKDGQTLDIEYHFNKQKVAMQMNIEDKPTTLMIINSDDNKIFMVADMNASQAIEMNFRNKEWDVDVDDYQVNKTGSSKTIDGYKCDEYIITSDDGIMTGWITKDLNVDSKDLFNSMSYFSKSSKKDYNRSFSNIEGFPIFFTMLTKGGKEKTEIKYYDINIGAFDANLFDTSKYEVMTMPSLLGDKN